MPDDPRRIAAPLPVDELDRESRISERDKVEDAAFWRAHGSPLTNRLLDATTADDGR